MSFIDSIVGWWKSEQKNWALITVTAPKALSFRGLWGDGLGINPHQAYVTAKMRVDGRGRNSQGFEPLSRVRSIHKSR